MARARPKGYAKLRDAATDAERAAIGRELQEEYERGKEARTGLRSGWTGHPAGLVAEGEAERQLREGTEAVRTVLKWSGATITEGGEWLGDCVAGAKHGSKLREIAGERKEYNKELEEEQSALKRKQVQVQAGIGDVVRDVKKLGDSIVDSFVTPPEYPTANLHEKWNEAQNNAALMEELQTSFLNHAKCIFGLSKLDRLKKTIISNHPKFRNILHHLNALQDRISQQTEMQEAAKKCAQQSRLAAYLYDRSDRAWRREVDEQNSCIQDANSANCVRRLWQASSVKKYADQNEIRVKELEYRRKNFETYVQENEAKIEKYRNTVIKRANAINNIISLNNRVTAINATLNNYVAQVDARVNQANPLPINLTAYTTAADNIIQNWAANAAMVGNLNNSITGSDTIANEAKTRKEEAESKKEEAKKWKEEAEGRSRIAKAYNLNGEPAKSTEQYAERIETLEQQAASSASSTESHMRQLENACKRIRDNIQEMNNIINAGIVAHAADNAAPGVAAGAGIAAAVAAGGAAGADATTVAIGAAAFAGVLLNAAQIQQLQKLRSEIAEAEATRNSTTASYKQSAIAEQTAARNIRNEFQNFGGTIANELPVVNEISMRALNDHGILQNFMVQQRGFLNLIGKDQTGARQSLIELEQDFAETTRQIEEDLREGINRAALPVLQARAQNLATNIQAAQGNFRVALRNFQNWQQDAVDVFKRNAIYMEQEIDNNLEQAAKYLKEIKHEHTKETAVAENDKGFLHFALDPLTGKFTIGQRRKNDAGEWVDERIYIDAKEIWSMTRLDDNRTEIKYRPELTEVSMTFLSRDGGAGRVEQKRKISVKRLEQEDFTGKGYHAIVAVPGNDFTTTEGRREKGYVIIQNRKQGDNGYTQPDVLNNLNFKAIYDGTSHHRTYLDAMIHAANGGAAGGGGAVVVAANALNNPVPPPNAAIRLTGMAAVDAVIAYLGDRNNGFHNTITVKTVDNMSTCSRIAITENLINEKGDIEVGAEISAQTRPTSIIYHDAVEAARATMTEEEKRHMWGINLKKEVFRMCDTGIEIPVKLIDFTETKFYPTSGGPAIGSGGGSAFRFNGPPELCWINLHALGTSIFLSEIWNEAVALEEKADHNFQETIQFLQQVVQQKDKEKIGDALGMVGFLTGIEAASIGEVRQELQKPPKDAQDWKDQRKKKKKEKEARPSEPLKAYIKSANAVLKPRRAYGKSVKQRIQNINEEDRLLGKDIRLSHRDPVKYSLEKRRISKRKQEFSDEIRAAHHLDKRISLPFQLLEDPKLGPPSPPAVVPATGSRVKSKLSDGRHGPNGLELFEEYLLWKGHDLSRVTEIEKQHVERYLEKIEEQFETNSAIPDSYRNTYRIVRALEVAHKGDFNQANAYIAALVQGSPPLSTDDSIVALIRSDEYHRIKYVKDSLAKVALENVRERIIPALEMADWVQRGSFNQIKETLRILDLETSSKKAEEKLGELQDNIPSIPQPLSRPDAQEKAKHAEIAEQSSEFKDWLKKSEAEKAQGAADITKKVAVYGPQIVQEMANMVDDPSLKAKIINAGPDLIKEVMKFNGEALKLNMDISFQLFKFERYCKRADKVWLKDLITSLMIMWMTAPTRFGSQMAQGMIGEMLKLALKTL